MKKFSLDQKSYSPKYNLADLRHQNELKDAAYFQELPL